MALALIDEDKIALGDEPRFAVLPPTTMSRSLCSEQEIGFGTDSSTDEDEDDDVDPIMIRLLDSMLPLNTQTPELLETFVTRAPALDEVRHEQLR